MPEVAIEVLKKAIRDLHGCDSTWIESVPVKETFQGEVVWEGIVQVFDLIGNPTAKRAYIWSHPSKGKKRRFIAVLHQGSIDSPQKAVRVAIVAEHKR